MVRRKVQLAFMQDKAARKVTYNKRVRGIMKKANELAVLCGIDVCALVYSVYDNAPVVYPSSEAEVRRILKKYMRRSQMDQAPRKQNQEEFLQQSLTKASEKLKRLKVRNKEMEMEDVISDLLLGKPLEQVPSNELDNLVWVIEDRMRAVEHMIRKEEGPKNAVDPVVNPSENVYNPYGNALTVPFQMSAGPWNPSHSHQPAPSLQADPSQQFGVFHQAGPSHSGGLWYPFHQSAPSLQTVPSYPGDLSHQAGLSHSDCVLYPSHQSTPCLQVVPYHPAGPSHQSDPSQQAGPSHAGGLLYPSYQSGPSLQSGPYYPAGPSQQSDPSHSGGLWCPSYYQHEP